MLAKKTKGTGTGDGRSLGRTWHLRLRVAVACMRLTGIAWAALTVWQPQSSFSAYTLELERLSESVAPHRTHTVDVLTPDGSYDQSSAKYLFGSCRGRQPPDVPPDRAWDIL